MPQINKDRISKETINHIASSYKALDYYVNLSALIKNAYPFLDIKDLKKSELHKLLNDILINNYHGEEVLKFKLFEEHQWKQNVVCAFEINVNKSRVDFLAINGKTTCFEIKSELDNLSKLKKQLADYSLVFEHNYLVVDYIHADRAYSMLPKHYGLWYYKNGKYKKVIKSNLNNNIDPEMQLTLLTKKELLLLYPRERADIKNILKSHSPIEINKLFKTALKTRYKNRWNFVIAHQNEILPIDIQFFFNTNIRPFLVYN